MESKATMTDEELVAAAVLLEVPVPFMAAVSIESEEDALRRVESGMRSLVAKGWLQQAGGEDGNSEIDTALAEIVRSVAQPDWMMHMTRLSQDGSAVTGAIIDGGGVRTLHYSPFDGVHEFHTEDEPTGELTFRMLDLDEIPEAHPDRQVQVLPDGAPGDAEHAPVAGDRIVLVVTTRVGDEMKSQAMAWINAEDGPWTVESDGRRFSFRPVDRAEIERRIAAVVPAR